MKLNWCAKKWQCEELCHSTINQDIKEPLLVLSRNISNTENIYGNLRHYTTHEMRKKMQTYCVLICTLLRTESKVSHRNMTPKTQTMGRICDEDNIQSTWVTRESLYMKGLKRTVKDPLQVNSIPGNEWKECCYMVLWTYVEQYMIMNYQNVTDRYKVKNYMTTQV